MAGRVSRRVGPPGAGYHEIDDRRDQDGTENGKSGCHAVPLCDADGMSSDALAAMGNL
jgi:hypothetical protein